MNIFVLDRNIDKIAEYHTDKHVVKMIVETAQLLCTAHWENNSQAPYKKTHPKHPSAIWARSSVENYLWLCKLGLALCSEYTYRYGKTHKTKTVIDWCLTNVPDLPKIGLTNFALAMPNQYKTKDAIVSYRKYYIEDKQHLASWKKRQVPSWYYKQEQLIVWI